MEDAEKRALWRQWWDAREAWQRQRDARLRELLTIIAEWQGSTTELQQLTSEYHALRMLHAPPPPVECRELRCGANAKYVQRPCRLRGWTRSGRCKYHGGLSTGRGRPKKR
jgi:hypothetical protein